MSADTTRYFAIAFEHDRDQYGLPPAQPMAINVIKPIMVNGTPDLAPETAVVQPIDGTRIYHTDDPVVAEALAQLPETLLIEIEKPSAKALKDQKDQTADYLAALKNAAASNTNPEA